MILSEETFSFTPIEYIDIHRRLFYGIYKFAGKLRNYNITKSEWVLHGATVYYTSAQSIRETLDYDFSQEKSFNYKGLSKQDSVEHITKFISDIWQIHAFGEGNTRTTAVFAIKYLRSFGFDVTNDIFAVNAWYFRNALVRANYNDLSRGIHATQEYLNRFFENLIFNEKNELLKETASGKTKEEAIMLLNHKDAIDFLIDNNDYLDPLSITGIENIHQILIKDLDVDKNLRTRRVGISGTNYQPLDNAFQIKEAMTTTCDLINERSNVFERALLALVLISYIQPFMDGNKRTARIVSNAILMAGKYCPISFRTVDSVDYKKAMLIFYEQNNISNFKDIFISQFKFAVNTYF